jgi:hypothetical protein
MLYAPELLVFAGAVGPKIHTARFLMGKPHAVVMIVSHRVSRVPHSSQHPARWSDDRKDKRPLLTSREVEPAKRKRNA